MRLGTAWVAPLCWRCLVGGQTCRLRLLLLLLSVMQAGVEWSLEEAKRQGMPSGSHYCDYLLFMDADQVGAKGCRRQPVGRAAVAQQMMGSCSSVCPTHHHSHMHRHMQCVPGV